MRQPGSLDFIGKTGEPAHGDRRICRYVQHQAASRDPGMILPFGCFGPGLCEILSINASIGYDESFSGA